MRVLTVRQPYAALILLGLKEFETRSRRTNVRGRIAIHAAKELPVKVGGACLVGPYPVWRKASGAFVYTPSGPVRLLAGHILGTVELDDIAPTVGSATFTQDELSLGDFAPGRWAWHLTNARLVRPVEANGKLGWWSIDEPLVELLPQAAPARQPDTPPPTPVAPGPVPPALLSAVLDRHDAEHGGPLMTCTDGVCDAAERSR